MKETNKRAGNVSVGIPALCVVRAPNCTGRPQAQRGLQSRPTVHRQTTGSDRAAQRDHTAHADHRLREGCSAGPQCTCRPRAQRGLRSRPTVHTQTMGSERAVQRAHSAHADHGLREACTGPTALMYLKLQPGD